MRKAFQSIFFVLIFISINNSLAFQTESLSDLHKKLLTIQDITVRIIESDSNFSEAFEIFVPQPVDHLNPNNGPKFTQRIYLRHVDFNKPMVFNNEGYGTNSKRRTELAKIIKCNEMFVEHRYFGESKPDSAIGWKYLTTAQA
ncbi:MAG: S28 family serine protease, partial [Melioribacteraceae bacterium]|nr:S28 family serine protease [Melioribacteraceae bacterium]